MLTRRRDTLRFPALQSQGASYTREAFSYNFLFFIDNFFLSDNGHSMRIVTVRRLSQIFFLLIFLWFCITATVGTAWWQLRGWPINWILELDPLTALATLLTTGGLYGNLLWAVVVIALTVFLGRFFCGFVCPLGTINQFTGWLGRRGLKPAGQVELNRHQPAQALKYYFLVFLLVLALMGSLQTGIIDPLPLVYRSVNLALLPLVDARSERAALLCVGVAPGGCVSGGVRPECGPATLLLPFHLPPGSAVRSVGTLQPLAPGQADCG